MIDSEGRRLLSRRVANNETELLALLSDPVPLGGGVTWPVDLNVGGAALPITLLVNHDQRVFYMPGRVVHRAPPMYRGDGKTDARDAAIIADQAACAAISGPCGAQAQHNTLPGEQVAADVVRRIVKALKALDR